MAGNQKPSDQIEQLLLFGKSTKGMDVTTIISQLLEAPGVYAFGEFLQLPCIQELTDDPDNGYAQLLYIFAYGTYHDYKIRRDTLPPLNDIQRNKLRHLSVVSLAANMKVIPYNILKNDLELVTVRQLEDLLIEALHAGVIHGKLDQSKQCLNADFCINRDVLPHARTSIIHTLIQWCSDCDTVLNEIEQQVEKANNFKKDHIKALKKTEAEVKCQTTIYQKILNSPSISGGHIWDSWMRRLTADPRHLN